MINRIRSILSPEITQMILIKEAQGYDIAQIVKTLLYKEDETETDVIASYREEDDIRSSIKMGMVVEAITTSILLKKEINMIKEQEKK